MSDTEEKSLMESIKECYTDNGGEVIWSSSSGSKVIILLGEYLPELVILTREGLGVRVATVNGACNANGFPARVFYNFSNFVAC